jgi:hypothetical protein
MSLAFLTRPARWHVAWIGLLAWPRPDEKQALEAVLKKANTYLDASRGQS